MGVQGTYVRAVLVGVLLSLTASSVIQAQVLGDRSVPRQEYFLALAIYYQGDYREALKAFRSAGNAGINTGLGRWADSICYATMMGECFYKLGDLPHALEQYDAALQLMIAQRGWQARLQLPPAVPPGAARAIPWGPSARQAIPLAFRDTILSAQGTNVQQAIQQGGLAIQPHMYPVHAYEIMRCIGLATRRRHELLGPLARQIPLTGQISGELATRQVPANHWFQNLIDVQLALAKAAEGDDKEALALLQRSHSIGGHFDHPLTPLALLEMGRISLVQRELDAAQRYFVEASISGAYFEQPEVIEEGLVQAARIHSLKGQAGVFPPLTTASTWAGANHLDRLMVACLVAMADQAVQTRNTKEATVLLAQARRAMGRSTLPLSDLGGRWLYLSAASGFQSGAEAPALKSLTDAQAIMKNHSTRLFQIDLTSKMYIAKTLSARVASSLFETLLREPTADDWQVDPAETLLVEMFPHLPALDRWLEMVIERRDVESILHVSETMRRHKFFTQTELGGRLLSLRWLLAAPDAMLTDEARQQRQALLNRDPELAALSRHMLQLKAQLADLPVAPTNPEAAKPYDRATSDLKRDAEQAEERLHSLALEPVAAVRMAPPLLSLSQLENKLREGQAILVFIETPRGMHAVWITSAKQYRTWQIKSTGRVRTALVTLLRDIGNFDQNQVLSAEKLTSAEWKTTAADIFTGLMDESAPQLLDGIKELTIVPDGFLWYLPFEMLQVKAGEGTKSLIDQVAIRYAPTAGWAVADGRPASSAGSRVIVHGRLFNRETAEITAAAAQRLQEQFPRSVVLRKRLPVATRFIAPEWRQLIVIDDIELNDREPLNWSPAQIDQGKPGGSLVDWLSLPWGAPDVIALPGYHTRSEDGLKGRLDGDEMLIANCGLMAAGSRAVLMSRWRTGGHLAMELVGEFFQGLEDQTPAFAWQRSIQLARSAQLDPSQEPRLKGVSADQMPVADHPFFWGAYLLLGNAD